MAKQLGVYLDLSNLYYCVGKRYDGAKLDYRKYLDYVQDLGALVVQKAYGAQMGNEARAFIKCLKLMGFDTYYKTPKQYDNTDTNSFKRKADQDVRIAVDIIDDVLAERVNRVILGSADGDMCPVVDWVQRRGCEIIVLSCGVSRDLKNTAREYIEIPASLLETNFGPTHTA